LLAALRKSDIRLPHFKRSFVGGSALPPSMIEVFRRDYDIALIHAWGMTETSPIGTINTPLSKHKALTQETQEKRGHGQGRVIFGIDLRVVDAQGQTLANDGESQGYLQVRGHWVAANYYGRPDTALTNDGWFDTGDIGTLDENGYLVIHDRAKDIIKSGGEWRILPLPIRRFAARRRLRRSIRAGMSVRCCCASGRKGAKLKSRSCWPGTRHGCRNGSCRTGFCSSMRSPSAPPVKS